MQAQVLSAIVNRVKIVRTIKYRQKYIIDLKHAGAGRVCVSVLNTKSDDSSYELRNGPIHIYSTFGSCFCFISLTNFVLWDASNRSWAGSYSSWPTLHVDELSSGYTPNGITACKSGAFLVSFWNQQVHDRSLGKVLKLSKKGRKQFEIGTDKNRPLFICPSYITENGNGDICVSDVNAVVVTDAGGFLRFRYTGAQSDPQFDPYGICCDSKNNIIVADMVRNRIHSIDENGELLHYIQYKDMNMPRALCIDEHDNLYVGEWLSEKIKVLSLQ
ncbi:uncharacterized protein LOC134245558 [Saccostrea cucullata]|uniref:uncharacterized protein LOC134245558 n=1 Tax=Saccostrea cuccullata TaxID=36930 RepID=UPI002ED07B98